MRSSPVSPGILVPDARVLRHTKAIGSAMISLLRWHSTVKTKYILLWWLSALALATFGVDDAHGIHVSDGRAEDVAVVTRPPASSRRDDGESLSGAISLNGSNNSGTDVAVVDMSEDQAELDVSLCLLLIVRDEEESLRANLPLWLDVADCFVIGIDDRTTDETPHVIQQVLGDHHPRFVFFYTFEGFAHARNVVLRSTAHNFPDATHIIVADADWRPNLATVDKSELDFVHDSFMFLVHDHTGHTSRAMGWLLRFDKGLRFKYRIHEELDSTAFGEGDSTRSAKVVGWEVQVVESDSNWSAKLHQHSRSSERYQLHLNLLELDYEDDPTDLHTLFYLGITKFAYLESLIGKGTHQKTPELDALVTSGMTYFRQAVDLYGGIEKSEFIWGSKRWLAYGYHYFVGDVEQAKAMYEDCIEYEPARVDCVASLGRLHLDTGDLDAAWTTSKAALLHRAPASRMLNDFYIFECFVPAQAATVISKRIVSASGSSGLGNDSLEGLLTTGWHLLRHHRDHCDHGMMMDSLEDIDRLESWFTETIAHEGLDVQEVKRFALLNEEESPLLGVLLRTWGTGTKASSSAWYLQTQQNQQEQGEQQQQQQQRQKREQEKEEGGAEEPQLSSDVADRMAGGAAEERAEAARLSRHPQDGEQLKVLDERAYRDDADLQPDTTGEDHASIRGAVIAKESCKKIVGEARTRLGLNGQMVAGALTATSVAQIDAVRAAGAEDVHKHFRALVLGGGGAGGGGGSEGQVGGLELEELLQVVSLLLQLSSTLRSEVTYVHPDPSAVEAARSVASSCANELGGDVRLDLVRSTLTDFLRTTNNAIDRPFDYIDVGGPLTSLGSGGGMNGKVNSALATATALSDTGSYVLDPATLKLLGHKLATGGHLRAWAFASNPSTELLFRAAKKVAAGADQETNRDVGTRTIPDETQTQERSSPGEGVGSLVGKILRTTFRIGQKGAPVNEEKSAPVPVQVGTAEEEAWTRQVSAGGDRMTVSDVVDVLADGGFELMLMLEGNNAAAERRAEVADGRAVHLGELLQGGLSRWEIADFAHSLDPTPALVHQILAVRSEYDSTTTTTTTTSAVS